LFVTLSANVRLGLKLLSTTGTMEQLALKTII
jgi:hypothetical protein